MPRNTLRRKAVVTIASASMALAATVSLEVGAAPVSGSPCASQVRQIPPRASDAPRGSEFVAAVAGLSERQREQAVRRELLAGNVPDFLRTALPVTTTASLADGSTVRLTFCVLPDYLSVGSDGDFLRVPMGLETALAVASTMGSTLPTRHMVDLIYKQASVRLSPQTLQAGKDMRSTAYYAEHQALVQRQRVAAGQPADVLTAGHKKDLVLTPRLWNHPGRVAIYGWHRGAQSPIQPLSTAHGARYADYSHGTRLVSNVVHVDGKPHSIFDVLADRRLAPLLSDEGPLPHLRELQAALPVDTLAQAQR